MRLTRQDGFSLAELAVVMGLGSIAVAMVAALLVAGTRGEKFNTGQSVSLDAVRETVSRVSRDVRGADYIDWCAPTGGCIVVGSSNPSGGPSTVKYAQAGSVLTRSSYNVPSATWSAPVTLISNMVNPSGQPVFACDTQSSLLRVNIDLLVKPTASSTGNYNVATTVRPRNFPSTANCPS